MITPLACSYTPTDLAVSALKGGGVPYIFSNICDRAFVSIPDLAMYPRRQNKTVMKHLSIPTARNSSNDRLNSLLAASFDFSAISVA